MIFLLPKIAFDSPLVEILLICKIEIKRHIIHEASYFLSELIASYIGTCIYHLIALSV